MSLIRTSSIVQVPAKKKNLYDFYALSEFEAKFIKLKIDVSHSYPKSKVKIHNSFIGGITGLQMKKNVCWHSDQICCNTQANVFTYLSFWAFIKPKIFNHP